MQTAFLKVSHSATNWSRSRGSFCFTLEHWTRQFSCGNPLVSYIQITQEVGGTCSIGCQGMICRCAAVRGWAKFFSDARAFGGIDQFSFLFRTMATEN